jgi:hypothetical protein
LMLDLGVGTRTRTGAGMGDARHNSTWDTT